MGTEYPNERSNIKAKLGQNSSPALSIKSRIRLRTYPPKKFPLKCQFLIHPPIRSLHHPNLQTSNTQHPTSKQLKIPETPINPKPSKSINQLSKITLNPHHPAYTHKSNPNYYHPQKTTPSNHLSASVNSPNPSTLNSQTQLTQKTTQQTPPILPILPILQSQSFLLRLIFNNKNVLSSQITVKKGDSLQPASQH